MSWKLLPASLRKFMRLSCLFSFLSSMGTAHHLCGWCHRHAQCGRCQYYRVYRGLLRLCKAVLCPTAPHPCNKQVRSWEKTSSSSGPALHTLLFGLDNQEFQHEVAKHQGSLLAVCFGQVTAPILPWFSSSIIWSRIPTLLPHGNNRIRHSLWDHSRP